MSIFIPDILDEILLFFDRDDLPQYRAFKRVCRGFLYAVRRRTWNFRNVRALSDEAIELLVDLLSSRVQTVSLHVRTIVLSGGDIGSPIGLPVLDVTDILLQCMNLLDVDIHNVRLTATRLRRMDLLASLRLSRVTLEQDCNILDVLKLCPSIRKLALIQQTSGPIGLVDVLVPVNIQVMELAFVPGGTCSDSSAHLLSWLESHPGYVPYLKRLAVDGMGVAHAHILEGFLAKELPAMTSLSVFAEDGDVVASDRLRYNTAFVRCNSWFRDGLGRELHHFGRRTTSVLENT